MPASTRGKSSRRVISLEAGPVEGIQMDVETPQTCAIEILSLFFEQHGIRGEGNIANARDSGDLFNQTRQFAAQERLAAGKTNLGNAQRHGRAHKSFDFFKCKNLRAIHEAHAFFGHAIETTDVAAIGDADAQTIVNASECVGQSRERFVNYRVHPTSSIRSRGRSARRMRSGASSTRGSRFASASRSFSSVFSRMNGHSLQLQFSLAT